MSGEAIIQKWAVLGNETAVCLHGEVYNHPDHPDGKLLTTPPIVRRFLEEDGSVVYVAKNRAMFKLGEVNPEYEEDFPGSMQRIVEEIKAGVPVCPGAPVAPGPAPVPAVIIEEKPHAPLLTAKEVLTDHETNRGGVSLAPGTPIPPLIRSTDRLPDVALFWWRPVEQSERTDVELDEEAFEKAWDPQGGDQDNRSLARTAFLAGCAAARARNK